MPDDHASTLGPALNTDFLPLGERALQSILDHVKSVGDEAETTYLEVKSPLDMDSKAAAAKIAKFLLGAANRRPGDAARHFRGYAVLVIGAQKGSAPGVPRGTEAHELEDRLRPYLGPQFPTFEFGRIGVSPEHEVLFVTAKPPEDGQTIFPCHKDFQGENRGDSLTDGAIYVRGASNSRPARAIEVQTLVERARGGGKPPIELEVEVLGPICKVDRVEEILETLLDHEEERFSTQPDPTGDGIAPVSFRMASEVFGTPFSAEDREEALTAWRHRKEEHIARGREHLLGAGLPGAGVRVISRDRFIAKPHLTITFHSCELVDHLDPADADVDKVVEPIVRSKNPFGPTVDPAHMRVVPQGCPVSWSNRGEDAEIVLTPEAFRPNTPWESHQDDYVLTARDPQASSVEVSWSLTEDGSDAVTSDTFTVPTAKLVDAAELFKEMLHSGD